MTGLSPNDNRSSPITGNTASDGSGTELRMLLDSSGRIILSSQNTDSGNFTSGQSLPTMITLAYGYDPINARAQRINVNSLGQISVYTP